MTRQVTATAQVRKVGNSHVITIPAAVMRVLGLTEGDYVKVSFDKIE